MIIPDHICYIIFEYIGNRAIIINKDLIKILDEKKQQFINKPLKIDYRLAKFKESRSSIKSIYKRRPSILVEKWKEIRLIGKHKIKCIEDNGKVEPNKEFGESLIPLSLAKAVHDSEMEYEYYYRVTYWELYEMFTKDVKRAKLYMMLFNYNK